MYASIFREGIFDGRTIVITGGGSGIGRCTAHELASLGAKVLITGRNAEKLERTAAEIRQDGGTAAHYVFDIRDEELVRSTVADMLADHGRIYGLVNNAGGQYPMALESIGKKGWEAVLATNLTGGFLIAREVYTQCMKASGGAIVNMIANMWSGMALMGHSGAARAGMMNFTKTAALEWASSGVRVNAVAPGPIASSGADHYDVNVLRSAMLPQLMKGLPLKRLGEEAEVSSAIVYLLSRGAAFITGTCIRIDGGASLVPMLLELPEHTKSEPYRGFHRASDPDALKNQSSQP
jgi:citronellol/citronellal dehydrogenase